LVGDDSRCDDGNACNGMETCDAANDACVPGEPLVCDDGVFCNGIDICDPQYGCVGVNACPPVSLQCGHQECDEVNDQCIIVSDDGECDDQKDCTDDVCNEFGECEFIPNDANSCDDGDVCTTLDKCDNGECVGGASPNCDDLEQSEEFGPCDTDGDGVSLLKECKAGTDPSNPESTPFRITEIIQVGDDIHLTWCAVCGTNIVQSSPGDVDGNFNNIFTDTSPDFIIPDDGIVCTNYVDIGGGTNKPNHYYTIRLKQ